MRWRHDVLSSQKARRTTRRSRPVAMRSAHCGNRRGASEDEAASAFPVLSGTREAGLIASGGCRSIRRTDDVADARAPLGGIDVSAFERGLQYYPRDAPRLSTYPETTWSVDGARWSSEFWV